MEVTNNTEDEVANKCIQEYNFITQDPQFLDLMSGKLMSILYILWQKYFILLMLSFSILFHIWKTFNNLNVS